MKSVLTVLGSGTSMGVPTIGCQCEVCTSSDPLDRRTRPSIMLEYAGKVVLIDTTPDFYAQAVKADPKNVATRTKLASSLYRSGDIDGALEQLNKALNYDPRDANALFDLGMIRLQGKGDNKGALAAWQRLLKTNPQLREDKKATVLKLMADVMTMMGDQNGRRSAGQ